MESSTQPTWKGRLLETLTKEELLQALSVAIRHIHDLQRWVHEERELRNLFQEKGQLL